MRDVVQSDLVWVAAMAEEFNKKFHDVRINHKKLLQWFNEHTNSQTSVFLTDGVGSAILGVVYEDPIRDWTMLVELGWYANNRNGIAALDAFETRGLELGVNEIRMTTLEINPHVVKVLARRGYTTIESSHRLLI